MNRTEQESTVETYRTQIKELLEKQFQSLMAASDKEAIEMRPLAAATVLLSVSKEMMVQLNVPGQCDEVQAINIMAAAPLMSMTKSITACHYKLEGVRTAVSIAHSSLQGTESLLGGYLRGLNPLRGVYLALAETKEFLSVED